ncbi:MAG: hypothetical protein OEY14_16450 [Myxococcales bacterium]|nr:hypothetical protein [Myxococcales bacterium]
MSRALLLALVLLGTSAAPSVSAQDAPAREGAEGLAPAVAGRAPNAFDVEAQEDPLGEVPSAPGADATAPPSSYAVPGARYPSLVPEPPPSAARARLPTRLATRIRVLETDLQAVASRGGNHILDGILGIVWGGVSITFGFLIEPPGRAYLLTFGAASAARGVVALTLHPDASGPSIAYGHLPMQTPEEAELRLRFGEEALERIATRSLLVRVLDASISMAAGVAVIPIFLGPNDYEITSTWDYFILIGAGVTVLGGVINLATRSPAEKRWSAYVELRDRLEGEERELASRRALEPTRGISWGFALAPLRGGALSTLSGRF